MVRSIIEEVGCECGSRAVFEKFKELYLALWPALKLESAADWVPTAAPSADIAKLTWESEVGSELLLYTTTVAKLKVTTVVPAGQYLETL